MKAGTITANLQRRNFLVIASISVLIIAVIGLVGFIFFKRPEQTNNNVVDFESCKSVVGVVRENFPEQCSYNGLTFTRTLTDEEKKQTKPLETAAADTPKKADESTTYTSLNFPQLKIAYPNSWTIEKQNLDFNSPDGKPQKDEAGKDIISGQIKLTKDNYTIVYSIVPIWDFGGYGPSNSCVKKDPYNKVLGDHFGRLRVFDPAGSSISSDYNATDTYTFSYIYSYYKGLIVPTDTNYSSIFGSEMSPAGVASDYDACFVSRRETGARLVATSYTQSGKTIPAVVRVLFKIKGENRNDDIFKEVDAIISSSTQ